MLAPLVARRRVRRAVEWLTGHEPDDPLAGAGVREPRRPLAPSLYGAAELELPDD